jgi:peptidoglycan/LPS O-acetylase OafA/YrhL
LVGARTYAGFRALERFPALDGLRAIAITIVIFEHSHNLTVQRASGGFNGVLLFFVLSGFLITSLLVREYERYGRVRLRAFAIRRAFRILPLFYAVLALYVVLENVLHFDDRAAAFVDVLPYYAGFFQEHVRFMAHPSGTPFFPFEVSWSLGIEEKFYLVWPMLGFVVLAKVQARYRILVASALALAAMSAPFIDRHVGIYFFYYGNILSGCVAALLLHTPRGYRAASWLGTRKGLGVALAVGALAHFGTYLFQQSQSDAKLLSQALVFVAFSVALTGLVTAEDSKVVRWLNRPLIVRIGQASYATYLIHLLFVNAAERVVPGSESLGGALVAMILAAVAATAAATVIQARFELPLTRYGHALSSRLFPRVMVGGKTANVADSART